MKNNRVRVGVAYIYAPVLLDLIDGRTGLTKGDRVLVIKSPQGCPSSGTMGHTYVGHPVTGEFIGMVHVNSLNAAGRAARTAARYGNRRARKQAEDSPGKRKTTDV